MNARAGPLSPTSPEGSDWSGISRYQSVNDPNSPYPGPPPGSRGGSGLASPPISSGSNGTVNGGMSNGVGRAPHDSPGNPSPPSSIARSSIGTGLYAPNDSSSTRKMMMLEELLSEHYVALRRYLAPSLRDEKGNPRPNRARDKLLRLSPVQFQELSTDVFDELIRRQEVQRYGAQGGPGPGPPQYLLPKDTFHPKRNQARQKLSTLPPPRFRDLATDVYFELERRFPRFVGREIDRVGSPASIRGMAFGGPGGSRPNSRGMGPRGPGPYPRNTPPGTSLGVPGSPGLGNEYGRPLPKTFQSNTIIPNKSTMVEDDDDQDGPFDDDESDAFGLEGAAGRRQSKRNTARRSVGGLERDKKIIADFEAQVGNLQAHVDELQDKLDHLESEGQEKDRQLQGLQGSSKDLHADLEDKLAHAQELNESLQSELDRIQANSKNMERSHRNQLDQARDEAQEQAREARSEAREEADEQIRILREQIQDLSANQSRGLPVSDGGEWKMKFNDLQRDHENLQSELQHQQQITDEVRQEASTFLSEMRAMASGGGDAFEREEQLVHQISSLESEVKEWKSRYARAKTQLRHLRASSIGLSIENPSAAKVAKDGGFTRPDGLVKDVHVTKFQIAIDELLRTARSEDPSVVIDYIKSVVVSVRHITQDIGEATTSKGEQASQRNKMMTRVSATANNLITAAKNFSASNGISPVSLLDAAASHLTAAVVELIRTVKIKPTPIGELEDDDDGNLPPGASPTFFPIRKGGVVSGESIYSVNSSPRPSLSRPRSSGRDAWGQRRPMSRNGQVNGKSQSSTLKMGFGMREDNEIEELKIYLEDQTENLVQSIQALVGSIRGEDGMHIVRDHIEDIAGVVGKVVDSTESAINSTGNPSLRDRGEPVTRKLSDCRTRLLNAGIDGGNIRDAVAMKEFFNKLPPLAFEIARETKELVQRIDQIEHDGSHNETDQFR